MVGDSNWRTHPCYPTQAWSFCRSAPFVGITNRRRASGGALRFYDTLHGAWINRPPLADQQAIAKSLI